MAHSVDIIYVVVDTATNAATLDLFLA